MFIFLRFSTHYCSTQNSPRNNAFLMESKKFTAPSVFSVKSHSGKLPSRRRRGKLPTAKGNEVLHNKVLQSQQPSQFNGFDECLSVCFLIYFLSMSAGILHRCNMFWLFTSHRFLLFCFCPCYPHTSEVRDVTNFHELTRV